MTEQSVHNWLLNWACGEFFNGPNSKAVIDTGKTHNDIREAKDWSRHIFSELSRSGGTVISMTFNALERRLGATPLLVLNVNRQGTICSRHGARKWCTICITARIRVSQARAICRTTAASSYSNQRHPIGGVAHQQWRFPSLDRRNQTAAVGRLPRFCDHLWCVRTR